MEVFATSLIFLCIFLDVGPFPLPPHTYSRSSLPRTLPKDVYLSVGEEKGGA